MKVLVCTVVHNPTDARIFRREIGALLDSGASVSAIAPWSADTPGDSRVNRIAVPRAVGRRRFRSLRAARARVRDYGADQDVVIIHDPELLLALPWRALTRSRTAVIWDVHEDLAAAILTKDYIPDVPAEVIGAGGSPGRTMGRTSLHLAARRKGLPSTLPQSARAGT